MSNKAEILISPNARKGGGGVTNFMSWNRFEQVLRASGHNLRPNEKVEKVIVDEQGIQIYYEQVAPK
jgi:hypothetical protein